MHFGVAGDQGVARGLLFDAQGKTSLVWTRSINGVDDTELRFAKQL